LLVSRNGNFEAAAGCRRRDGVVTAQAIALGSSEEEELMMS
jgi:hypothetical protein